MNTPRHGLVLLAAGGSRRLGQPKQLLRYRGESLVRRAARIGLETLPDDAVVVCGAGAEAVWAELADLPLRRVDCTDWAAGLGASLAIGLAGLPAAIDGALVLLCDQPALEARHLLALRDAWRRDCTRAAASAYAGVLGVPALLPRAWFAELAGRHDHGARELLRAHAETVHAVAAAALAEDVDTPDQARAFTPPLLGANRREE